MRFLHLSDLHLGKRVCEFSMLEDQRYILEEILTLLDETPVDGVLLAGDLYDKPVPPAEAVRLLDWFLTQLAARKLPVFAISGNHDSADRVAFGSALLADSRVYVSPVFTGAPQPIPLQDAHGTVDVYLLPFLKPAMVRHVWPDEPIESYNDALACVLRHCTPDPGHRSVLVAHQFVAGAAACESEEPSVGGVDSVDAALFDAFDYVALGHLHSPQKVGRETLRYCGTPLKYSFSEAGQHKSATFVELGAKGEVHITTAPLTPRHDLRGLRGSYMELTDRRCYEGTAVDDYLYVTLTDEQDVPDALARLRVIYPNLMQLDYDNQRTRQQQEISAPDPPARPARAAGQLHGTDRPPLLRGHRRGRLPVRHPDRRAGCTGCAGAAAGHLPQPDAAGLRQPTHPPAAGDQRPGAHREHLPAGASGSLLPAAE